MDKDKTLKAFKACGTPGACEKCAYNAEHNYCYRALKQDVLQLLREQQEQRHGHWIRPPKFLSESQCSVCKETHVGDYRMFNYCPNCGARMDEEVKQDAQR